MLDPGYIKLVDSLNRTVATVGLARLERAESELYRAVARWERFEVVGGYAYDRAGNLLSYC